MVQPPEKIEEQVKEFEVFCRSKGLKATHQRLEIFRELTGREDHPSAEMIYHSLHSKLPTLALDTVYRTWVFWKNPAGRFECPRLTTRPGSTRPWYLTSI